MTVTSWVHIVRCNPDDYMVACLLMTASLYLVIFFPLMMSVFCLSGGMVFFQAGKSGAREEAADPYASEVAKVLAEVGENRRSQGAVSRKMTDIELADMVKGVKPLTV